MRNIDWDTSKARSSDKYGEKEQKIKNFPRMFM